MMSSLMDAGMTGLSIFDDNLSLDLGFFFKKSSHNLEIVFGLMLLTLSFDGLAARLS